MRTADATERFMAANGSVSADDPSQHMNTRWVGNPGIDPEQHHQLELGAQANASG